MVTRKQRGRNWESSPLVIHFPQTGSISQYCHHAKIPSGAESTDLTRGLGVRQLSKAHLLSSKPSTDPSEDTSDSNHHTKQMSHKQQLVNAHHVEHHLAAKKEHTSHLDMLRLCFQRDSPAFYHMMSGRKQDLNGEQGSVLEGTFLCGRGSGHCCCTLQT